MFGNLTSGERAALARVLNQAALDTLTEVCSAVKMGQRAFDGAYGEGLALGHVNVAHDQVMTLVDLVVTTAGRPL